MMGRGRSVIGRRGRNAPSLPLAFAAAIACLLTVPAIAIAHVERASYWPDPAPDCSIKPCAGGAVPKIRALKSALNSTQPGKPHGVTRVVCQQDSLERLEKSIADTMANHGYVLRPTHPR